MKKWFGIRSKKQKPFSDADIDDEDKRSTGYSAGPRMMNGKSKAGDSSGRMATTFDSHASKALPGRNNQADPNSLANPGGPTLVKQSDILQRSTNASTKSDWNFSSSSGSDRQPISSDDEDPFSTKPVPFESLPTSNLSAQIERLESIVTDAMDYLANEGLVYPRLFRNITARPQSDALIDASIVENGEKIDFIERNDASLAAGVLIASLSRFHQPIFPTSLFDLLISTLESSQNVHQDQKHMIWKEIITDAMTSNRISPIFLNLLGLFNLILDHKAENNVSSELLELHFSPFFLPSTEVAKSRPEMQARLVKAGKVLTELTMHIYKIFPEKVWLS
jgi:hypothetical protein